MNAPIARVVDPITGTVTAATVIRDIDDLIAARDANAAAFAAAVAFYDCPCGSEFEFTDTMGLEDYAALNRWLGEHVGKCGSQVPAVSMAGALVVVEEMVAQRDTAIRERDDARAERDNMVNLTIEVGRLGDYLRHAIADRDDYREQADEIREKYDAAQCRMDEMAAEIRELQTELATARTERDTAKVQASL